MTRSTIKLSTIGAAFAIGAAVFAGQASSAVRDSRSPDTRDAAYAVHQQVVLDGRSPDARDSAYAEQLAVDGRSPDTRDGAGVVAHRYGQTRTPAEMIALHFKHEDALYRARASASGPPRSATATEVGASDGFDWGDAGIGAISGLGVSVLLLGGALVLLRRRGEPVSTATS
jgi:hypothetical protein